MLIQQLLTLCYVIAVGSCASLSGANEADESANQKHPHQLLRKSLSENGGGRSPHIEGAVPTMENGGRETSDVSVLFPYQSVWFFTDEIQHGEDWKTAIPDWSQDRSFPPLQSNVRYFCKTIVINDTANPVYSLTMKMCSSFSVFVNGGNLFSWGLPSYGPRPASGPSFFSTRAEEITLVFRACDFQQLNDTTIHIAVIVYRPLHLPDAPVCFDAELRASSSYSVPTLPTNGVLATNAPSSAAGLIYSAQPADWVVPNVTQPVWTR